MPSTLFEQTTAALHAAIIMDGNGRWATRRGLPRSAGHVAGVSALRRVTSAAPSLGVSTLTVYAFSSDNWRRPHGEVNALMGLLRTYLRQDVHELVHHGIRLQVIGRRDRLPAGVADAITEAEAATRRGTNLLLRVAIDYSSRDAILAAAAVCSPHATRHELAQHLAGASAAPDVDLLIRTGGEKRLSDFLLWEAAYAELHFTDKLWPDYDGDDLRAALADFASRDRRYGGLPVQPAPVEQLATASPLRPAQSDDRPACTLASGAP
ncbi:MAG: di-trans,poly-cis-decaprenylcistransferase [Hyphomicrobiaceae bacterium]